VEAFTAGTLAGAGSFRCESCGFAVALHELDEVPGCPQCGGRKFKRASMFMARQPEHTQELEQVRFDDPTVSRRHALIHRDRTGARVLDDRSLNGVFLNGDRVDWHELEDGDEIAIGAFRLYFMRVRTDTPTGASGLKLAPGV
jgi:hypothetical protein